MALSASHQEQKKAMPLVASQLLTPEEPLAHSFSKNAPLPPIQTASPPVSPEFRSYPPHASFEQNDDVLYPDHTTAPERPLFDNSNRWSTPEREQSPATESSLSGPATPSQGGSPQQPDIAKLVITEERSKGQNECVGPVALYNLYQLDYWRYCLAQSEDHRRRRVERKLPQPGTSRGARRDQYTQKMVSSLGRTRVEKPRVVTPSTTPKIKVAKPAPTRPNTRMEAFSSMPKSESPVKRSRRKASTPDAAFGAYSGAPQPKPRTRAAPSKKVDDKEPEDWTQIPDRCPPLSSLLDGSKRLTVVWSNANALDLSNDPDRHHLHPQELEVAQALRLKCNQYLANKRRIFVARVNALREGKEFNKTSAQTHTKIDVNKASRLWSAFDGVGWFDEKWFAEWL